ncbi:type II toxin-antitoxin system death-on-curing family toxin [Candidatus Woesearchaeota archaeon]|nr:type II toxin-antitoxin system death-on-curing family toxin [Candidatus Woesearchaeota archaeon]
MVEVIYPTVEKIVEYNVLALRLIKVKKADQPKILSRQRIVNIIEEAKSTDGDIYDKSVVLFKGLIQKHPFASGNRRTAFIVAKEFLLSNHQAFNIEDNPLQARAMQGIRENYYTDDEIKEWITHGKIREFKRW